MTCIDIHNLSVAYGDAPVIHALDLEIHKGAITAIIGPNGCGKSTLLKTIGRILKPDKGYVLLDGRDMVTLPSKRIAQHLSVLPQAPMAPEGLRVGDLVSYGRFPHKEGFRSLNAADRAAIQWALEATGLAADSEMSVEALSGGQRQRAWIAMAIAQQTEVILLDEPTTYMDMRYQLEVIELLHHLNRTQKTTMIMVLHDLNLAARYSDYMIVMRAGEIIEYGEPQAVMMPDILKAAFSVEAQIVTDIRTGRPTCLSYDLIHPCEKEHI